MKKQTKILLIVCCLLISLLTVGFIFLPMTAYYVTGYAAQKKYDDVKSIVVLKPPEPTKSFSFRQDFRIVTADKPTKHFVKLKLSLGMALNQPELEQRQVQMRNIINLILSGKTKAQLDSIPEQLDLRDEIKTAINHILSSGKINEVYFNELIVN